MSNETSIIEKTDTKKKIHKPPKFSVILLNDDYTTFDFVIFILTKIFKKTVADAIKITQAIDKSGQEIVGIYDKQISESKIYQVHELARLNKMPLKAIMKKMD